MLSLRQTFTREFITEDNRPQGMFLVPPDASIHEAVAKTRRALLRPDISSVAIRRNYLDLTSIANEVFSGNTSNYYTYPKACTTPCFENPAGRDFLAVMDGFAVDQNFEEVYIKTNLNHVLQSHIDDFQQVDVQDNHDIGYLAGAIVILQALSVSGTGIYCESELKEKCIAPKHTALGWTYEDERAEAENISPSFVAPGDILVFRQGDWGPCYPPSVHTWPVCAKEDRRVMYDAIGYAKPVFAKPVFC